MIMENNRLLTEIDLQIEFKSETGIDAYNKYNIDGDRKKPKSYTRWLEEKLLKLENDKVKISNLFVEAFEIQ